MLESDATECLLLGPDLSGLFLVCAKLSSAGLKDKVHAIVENMINISTQVAITGKLVRTPFLTAIFSGLILGAIGIGISSVMQKMMPTPPQLAGDALFQAAPIWMVLLMVTIWGPVFETMVAQVIPVFMVRKITGRQTWLVIASAAVFGMGHILNGGGWAQLILTFFFGLAYAAAYVTWLPQGYLKAATAVALMHATNNALICAFSFIVSS